MSLPCALSRVYVLAARSAFVMGHRVIGSWSLLGGLVVVANGLFCGCSSDSSSRSNVTPAGGTGGATALDLAAAEIGSVTIAGLATSATGHALQTFTGAPQPRKSGDAIVKCGYTPNGTYVDGILQPPSVSVYLQLAGRTTPEAELRIRHTGAEPFSEEVTYDKSTSGAELYTVARLTHDTTEEVREYHYYFDDRVTPSAQSQCTVDVTRFDDERLSGQVACRDLFPTPKSGDYPAGTSAKMPTASATIAFDCPLQVMSSPGDDGTHGGGGAGGGATGGASAGGSSGMGGVSGHAGASGGGGTGGVQEVAPNLLTKLVPAAPRFDTRVDQISGSALQAMAQTYAASGYVVTAATTNTAGYTLWGFKPQGSAAPYNAKVDQVAGASLDSVTASDAASGFVITAAATNTAGYTLWAFQPKSSTVVYDYKQDQFSGASLDDVASAYAAAGYVITAAVTNTAGYTVWAFKPKNSTVTYDYKLDQISGSLLDTTAASYAAAGYVITAATTNTAGYTLWAFKPKNSAVTYASRLDQISGSSLSGSAMYDGANGFLITTAVTNTAGYTIWATKPN